MHSLVTVEDAERLVQASPLSHIKVGLSGRRHVGRVPGGVALACVCDVVLGWDLRLNTKYSPGAHCLDAMLGASCPHTACHRAGGLGAKIWQAGKLAGSKARPPAPLGATYADLAEGTGYAVHAGI